MESLKMVLWAIRGRHVGQGSRTCIFCNTVGAKLQKRHGFLNQQRLAMSLYISKASSDINSWDWILILYVFTAVIYDWFCCYGSRKIMLICGHPVLIQIFLFYKWINSEYMAGSDFLVTDFLKVLVWHYGSIYSYILKWNEFELRAMFEQGQNIFFVYIYPEKGI